MLNDDIGTARRAAHDRERLATARQRQHEARKAYPSRLTLLMARLWSALHARRSSHAAEAPARPVRVRPARRPTNR